MRPLRFLLTLISCCLAFLLLLAIGPWIGSSRAETSTQENYNSYYWHTPSSLFPPSAIISITDDNSTNFLARPAAFGPLLPSKSLSGQLWIGSGFGDDHLGRGGSGAGAELGCSDVPGWEDGKWYGAKKIPADVKGTTAEKMMASTGKERRSLKEGEDEEDNDEAQPTEHDGTDDHLHHPLLDTGKPAGTGKKTAHADIQSLQESAEIAGKVVLLSRGGCGFLEKVKWVQRRGGIALIVGDDIRGGPLVTMYARGDTSNVTIPSVFISHMTAQLLSSLMPSGALSGNLDDGLGQTVKVDGKGGKTEKAKLTSTTASAKATSTTSAKNVKEASTQNEDETTDIHRGWFSFFTGSATKSKNSRRPPSSGEIDWSSQKKLEDDGVKKVVKTALTSTSESDTQPKSGNRDGFMIGVQDWRDPDLVAAAKESQQSISTSASSTSATRSKTSQVSTSTLQGGRITPGSGQYKKSQHTAVDLQQGSESDSVDSTSHKTYQDGHPGRSRSWFGRLFFSTPGQSDDSSRLAEGHSASASSTNDADVLLPPTDGETAPGDDEPHHEGLWVTLSPASMSTSPFFDTLLVLVVSPLVTLTIVYAMLLLRSRIRRRRWRAPKSVVERLPVRTYQTMPSTTTSSSQSEISAAASLPAMSTAVPTSPTSPTTTTPLLQASSRPITTRPPRPRSRTTSTIPPASSSLLSTDSASPILDQLEEKRASGLAEWRRRYGGKQRECVVCLEEYVDGVSRVMSLPCGHEFHAECITPWLTTRRRTCPICKGDVVRSLARSSGSTPRSAAEDSYLASESFPPSTSAETRRGFELVEEDEERRGRVEVADEETVLLGHEDGVRAREDVSREREAEEDLERGGGR
ncbi:unnamed protein product [Zymoseptoria tritici ST99CH_3D7]|uniref:RING-type E3 ubiquitin transferase n=1 Tax=Zymoseptoria tritici (strain ST99CH_3D7) TaxID=1276538 RepID=A0A1X7S8Z5_ZYMT9|nr:unnamed protein product [Zymoseptoria tritici ST99CH_3D7]